MKPFQVQLTQIPLTFEEKNANQYIVFCFMSSLAMLFNIVLNYDTPFFRNL